MSKTTLGSMARGTKARDVWKVRCQTCRRKKVYSALTWSGNVCPDCLKAEEEAGPKMGEH